MKRIIIALMALLTMAGAAKAMSYEQARIQALFLTDKMAYELNLTEEQYEAAYEINLDYLMGINHYNDIYGRYWTQRNLDLSYILLDWQYRAYCAANYFYRPLHWSDGVWRFRIYARYPRRNYYYFGRPHFYTVYRGGHSWRNNGGSSWYRGREFVRKGKIGMRDGFDRGDYGKGSRFDRTRPSHRDYDNKNNRSDRNYRFPEGGKSSNWRDNGSSTQPDRPASSNHDGFNNGTSPRVRPGKFLKTERGSAAIEETQKRPTTGNFDRNRNDRYESSTRTTVGRIQPSSNGFGRANSGVKSSNPQPSNQTFSPSRQSSNSRSGGFSSPSSNSSNKGGTRGGGHFGRK